ncbi:MAG: DUF3145 family protein [Actinobacteria bacterium]|uniref:Unannotated protein n=1 Tax=freshwater metagenome TaxID=449393 RepID=A0A6J5ZTR2_9ZZZZ|nr:DUF3145 family protein [Actinomycetota bacterium]
MAVTQSPHGVDARGVVFIHSCPRALCSHVEWALGSLLGVAVHLEWADQPVASSTMRAELSWVGAPTLATAIASSLRGYPNLRFEVTEEPSPGYDGQRFMSTPSLGVWRSAMGVFGETLIAEDRIRTAVTSAAAEGKSTVEAIDDILGGPWDRELEPFRFAGDGVPVRWLHQVG